MDKNDKTLFDIDELAHRIEARINELEAEKKKEEKEKPYDLNALIADIDCKIQELDKKIAKEEPFLDINKVTKKINAKLDHLDDEISDDLDKTISDLREINKVINDSMAKFYRDKEKKRKKAKYCELARKQGNKKK